MANAEEILSDLLDVILDKKRNKTAEVTVTPITSSGANFTSTLFFVNVSSPDREDLKLFAKVACIGEVWRAPMSADWLYGTERFVYTELIKIYEDIQIKNNVAREHRYLFPKFYGHSSELGKETIVIENLIETGYKTYNRLKSIDWEHASAAVENLAKFHALSFAFEKYEPEQFYRLTPNMTFKIGSSEGEPSDEMKALWDKLINKYLNAIKEDHREKVRLFLANHKRLTEYNRPIGIPVISHGDYKLSNLLFKKQNGSLQTITVDYQTVHAGCPAGDLVYFIFMGSGEEFRREYYEQLVDHYFMSLGQALERLSVDPNVYPREKFDSDMKELLPYAVLLGVMILPVVTVDAELAPTVDSNADVTDFMMEPNELYAKRFNGIVNDCIRWGVI